MFSNGQIRVTGLSADLLNIQSPLLTNEQAQGNLLQYHKERLENLPDDEQVIKLCTDAGFIKTVAPGQYFMTKDAEEFHYLMVIWHVQRKLYFEKKNHQNQKDGCVETQRLVQC